MAVVEDLIRTRLEVAGLGGYQSTILRAAESVGVLSRSLDEAGRAELAFAGVAGAGALAMVGAFGKAVRAAGELQQIRVAFTDLLGSEDAAAKKLEEIRNLANQTPFAFKDLAQGARQLSDMGVSADQLVPVLRAVSNAAALAGGGTDKLSIAVQALGKVQDNAANISRRLMALETAGIPVFSILKEQLGLTADQLKNLSKSGVDASQIIPALIRGLSQGKWAEAAAHQANTLEGSFKKLSDAVFQLSAVVGGPLLGPLTTVIQSATGFLNLISKIPGAGVAIGLGMAYATYRLTAYTVQTLKALGATLSLTAAMARAGSVASGGGAGGAAAAAGGFTRGKPTMEWRQGPLGPYQVPVGRQYYPGEHGYGAWAAAQAAEGEVAAGGGFMGRMRAGLAGKGGLITGLGLGIGGSVLSSAGENTGGFWGGAERVLGAGATGAGIGSLGGPWGTAIGAAIGLLGGAIGEFTRTQQAQQVKSDPQVAELQKLVSLQEKQLAETRNLREGKVDVLGGPASAREALIPGRVLRYLAAETR